MKVDLNSPLSKKIATLKMNTSLPVLTGDYKQAIEAHKELAKIAVDNFELTIKTPNPIQGRFSLFSKEGWNALVFIFLEKFRKKTPEEKRFAKMIELYEEGHLKPGESCVLLGKTNS